jgi:proton-coupled amino acid transporter
MLLRIVDEIDQPNLGFSDITRIILGEKYVYMNKLFIILMQWGCCASYVLFFMEFLEYAIYHHHDVVFSHQLIYLAIAMCIIVPLVFINSMTIFTKFSAVANVSYYGNQEPHNHFLDLLYGLFHNKLSG